MDERHDTITDDIITTGRTAGVSVRRTRRRSIRTHLLGILTTLLAVAILAACGAAGSGQEAVGSPETSTTTSTTEPPPPPPSEPPHRVTHSPAEVCDHVYDAWLASDPGGVTDVAVDGAVAGLADHRFVADTGVDQPAEHRYGDGDCVIGHFGEDGVVFGIVEIVHGSAGAGATSVTWYGWGGEVPEDAVEVITGRFPEYTPMPVLTEPWVVCSTMYEAWIVGDVALADTVAAPEATDALFAVPFGGYEADVRSDGYECLVELAGEYAPMYAEIVIHGDGHVGANAVDVVWHGMDGSYPDHVIDMVERLYGYAPMPVLTEPDGDVFDGEPVTDPGYVCGELYWALLAGDRHAAMGSADPTTVDALFTRTVSYAGGLPKNAYSSNGYDCFYPTGDAGEIAEVVLIGGGSEPVTAVDVVWHGEADFFADPDLAGRFDAGLI